jgi:hypothetical protein
MIDRREYPLIVPLQHAAMTQLRRIGLPLEANQLALAEDIDVVDSILRDVNEYIEKSLVIVTARLPGVAALLRHRLKKPRAALHALGMATEDEQERRFTEVWGQDG